MLCMRRKILLCLPACLPPASSPAGFARHDASKVLRISFSTVADDGN